MIAVCSERYAKHVSMLRGQNADFLLLNRVAHAATAVLWRDNKTHKDTLICRSCITYTVITILSFEA
jgi:hypothetical protein